MHLGGPLTQTTMADRAAGYRESVQAASIPPDMVESDGTPEDGEGDCESLISMRAK